jgi:hypothetical protein
MPLSTTFSETVFPDHAPVRRTRGHILACSYSHNKSGNFRDLGVPHHNSGTNFRYPG